mmetsp:Transcript_20977/g.34970  ORF Transcript_20977/g.34970 Transcript_20977/m.34970 type:complete len:222 (+) Transcript_20977:224-889(+)|eukprot:CAMPEP_0184671570 /NCGR_PEP_ID=MMETSP0308-20130426/85584_1 /TAXON_ID=38269 /ORGANISM="Gloeochaete witrockiana, Strain SAG 46.84" /LENGTH=221 /DNA_ID=CAMNT_0027118731 /DNA_START=145 /DNA_END=810 /DNA_ORIENTATION=+
MAAKGCFRGTLIAVNSLFLALSAVIIGVAAWIWVKGDIKIFGQGNQSPVALLVMGCVLFGCALLGLVATYTTNSCLLFIYGLLLFCVFVVTVAVSIFLFVVAGKVSVSDVYWTDRLRNYWIDAAKNEPSIVCNFMNSFKCQGFDTSCALAPAQCPATCDANTAGYIDFCYPDLQNEIKKNFNLIAGICIATSSVMLLALIFTCSLCGYNRKNKGSGSSSVV